MQNPATQTRLDVRCWHFSEVPVSVRDVCLSGKTGSNRWRLKTTRLTLNGHLVSYVQTILTPSVPSLPQDTHLKIARDPECFRGKEGG